jgi:hypothetical protein
MQDETAAWAGQLTPHVLATYTQWNHCPQKPTPGIVQVPTLCNLLRNIQYDNVDELEYDLTHGFPMVGRITPGTGWWQRLDKKYQEPMSLPEFEQANQSYKNQKSKITN